jgi:hypothetical protein
MLFVTIMVSCLEKVQENSNLSFILILFLVEYALAKETMNL